MAKLVKIKEVLFYVGVTEHAQDVWNLKKALQDAGIQYLVMSYMDDSAHEGVFKSLSTWNWGIPPDLRKEDITRFPILTWKMCFDDFETAVECAFTVEQFQERLLPHKDLI